MSLPDRRPGASVPAAAPAWTSRLTRADVRVGDTERNAVVEQLSEHYAQGRLAHEDLAARTQVAMQARTRGELARVVSDLPSLAAPVRQVPIAAIVVATVLAAVLAPVAGVTFIVSLFTLFTKIFWSLFLGSIATGAIAAGAGWFAARGVQQRRVAKRTAQPF